MGLLGWLKRKSNGGDPRLSHWRRAWNDAVGSPGRGDEAALGSELDALGLAEDDIEVERCTFDAPFRIDGGEGNNRAFFLGIRINGGSTSGGGVTAGARGHSGNVWWAFVIVHVFP